MGIGGLLLVAALLPSCVLYLGRSNVTPSLDRRALSPGLHRYCAENAARWNRLRLHMLGPAWFTIFVVGALVVAALSIGTSASRKRRKRTMPEPIPDSLENVAAALMSSPPRKPDERRYDQDRDE